MFCPRHMVTTRRAVRRRHMYCDLYRGYLKKKRQRPIEWRDVLEQSLAYTLTKEFCLIEIVNISQGYVRSV